MLLHSALPTLGFGRLGTKAAPSHNLTSTFDSCHAKLGNTLGEPWMSCVVEMLLAKQEAAQQAGTDYFPIAAHSYDPFKQSSGSSSESESLKNKMRDYSCDVADGGSQPLRTTSWEYETPDPCSAGGAAQMGEFIYKSNRFLPAGNDIPGLGGGGQMSVEQAEAACAAEPRCQGFTFSAARWSDSPAARRQKQHSVSFKSEGDDSAAGEGWHTFKRRKAPLDCGGGGGGGRDEREVKKLRVHVLRESPPVYIVDDFLTASECDYMLNYTLPKMGPSVVIGGSTSSWRQSFSVNMYPDYDDESHVITRVARRKFAFARDFVGYTDEPVNAVYYQNFGDHYGAHCDGECNGGYYKRGHRIATSLTYCQVADKGGFTLFTRSGLKVVPKPRQMLFFGYKLDPAETSMDRGHTEHSGCPLREGHKWIATMWYREGVTPEKDWSMFTV